MSDENLKIEIANLVVELSQLDKTSFPGFMRAGRVEDEISL